MKLFGVWIFSTILSYIMELVSGLCIYKRAADQGYKINNKKLSEAIKSFGANNNNNKLEKIIYFVPFANITYAFLKSLDSTRYLDSYLDQLDALGLIDKMSDFEINKYNKNQL